MAANSLVWASEGTLVWRERSFTRARARSTTSASDNSLLLSKTIRQRERDDYTPNAVAVTSRLIN